MRGGTTLRRLRGEHERLSEGRGFLEPPRFQLMQLRSIRTVRPLRWSRDSGRWAVRPQAATTYGALGRHRIFRGRPWAGPPAPLAGTVALRPAGAGHRATPAPGRTRRTVGSGSCRWPIGCARRFKRRVRAGKREGEDERDRTEASPPSPSSASATLWATICLPRWEGRVEWVLEQSQTRAVAAASECHLGSALQPTALLGVQLLDELFDDLGQRCGPLVPIMKRSPSRPEKPIETSRVWNWCRDEGSALCRGFHG